MDDMTAQMNAILNNPEMMQKIMTLANSLDSSPKTGNSDTPKQDAPTSSFPDLDIAAIQKLAGFAGKTNIDGNQKSLLNALAPYLSKERIQKLERAMRAAKLAGMASLLFGNASSPFRAGR